MSNDFTSHASSKYRIKDEILKYLTDPKNGSRSAVSDISKILGYDYNLLSYLSDELIAEKFVESLDITSRDRDMKEDKSLIIKNKGIYFLEYEGGHARREVLDRQKEQEELAFRKLLKEFHETSIDKNRDQILFIWLSIGIAFLSLIISIFR